MTTIKFNATKMFGMWEPWDCSNSVANLGSRAAELTWGCAMEVAAAHEAWLLTPLSEALDLIREDAAGYGAWDRDEIQAWTPEECLALFVQNVASDLRLQGSDDHELAECVRMFKDTDWDKKSEYPTISIWAEGDEVMGERYMGV